LFIFKKIFGNEFVIFNIYVDDKNIIRTPEELMRYFHFLQNKVFEEYFVNHKAYIANFLK
jgi:hypothetical protein